MPRFELVLPTDARRPDECRPAPRVPSLDGLRIGLLDNRKGNGNVLLARVAEQLATHHNPAGFELEEKRIYSRPAADEQLDRLAERCGAVITAIGD